MFLKEQGEPCASGKGAVAAFGEKATKGLVQSAANVIKQLWETLETEVKRSCGMIDKEELLGYLLGDVLLGELLPRSDARAVGHKAAKLVWARPPKKPPLAADLAAIRKRASARRSRLPEVDRVAAAAAEAAECAAVLAMRFELPLPSARRCSAVVQAKRRRDSLSPEEQLLIATSTAGRAEKRARQMRELECKHGMGSAMDRAASERVYRRAAAETEAVCARHAQQTLAAQIERARALERADAEFERLAARQPQPSPPPELQHSQATLETLKASLAHCGTHSSRSAWTCFMRRASRFAVRAVVVSSML